jgi:malonyl-CoA O-methyltransferase
MSPIDKTIVKKSFNASADTYDRYAGLQNHLGEQLLKLVAPGEGMSGARMLDIGMGTGNLTSRLMQRFPEARMYGCDLAVNMMVHARKKLLAPPYSLLLAAADAENLPYCSNSFDLVASSFTYQWLEDWSTALKEARRVIKPQGVFVFSAFGAGTFYELRQSYNKACMETGYTRGVALELSITEASIRRQMNACGFADPSTTSWKIIEPYISANDLIRSIKGMGARNASARRNKTPGVRKIWKRMVEQYENDFGMQGKIPATFEIIMGSAKKP